VLCHLDAGYNLARWLMGDGHDASDALQNAAIKAYEAYSRLRGEPKPWFLAIVRNECMNSLRRRNLARAKEWSIETGLEEEAASADSPERTALREYDRESIQSAIDGLPGPQREALLLREMEDLSYQEIADITGVPVGTVMSRLSRARSALQTTLGAEVRP